MQRSEERRKSAWLERRACEKAKYEIVQKLKSKPCADCGQCFDPVCMDFHHLDPNTKIDGVSSMMVSSSLKRIVEEINKCALLCSNCHRLRHKDECRRG